MTEREGQSRKEIPYLLLGFLNVLNGQGLSGAKAGVMNSTWISIVDSSVTA